MSYNTPHTASTTFANGINPFAGLGAMPKVKPITHTQPKPIMQKPAKPAKTKRTTEDYSTPYQPPAAEVAAEPAAPADDADLDSLGLSITNDPFLASAVGGNKYSTVFERMQLGQCVRVRTDSVDKVSNALRKWVGYKGLSAHVKARPSYCTDTGFGRVWLLAGPSSYPSRKKGE